MSFTNFNANNGTNNFTSSIGVSFNSHSSNGKSKSGSVNISKKETSWSDLIADKVRALEKSNSDIQSLIEKVVEEQLKTVMVEKHLRNEFSILNSTTVNENEVLSPDYVTNMINYRGSLILQHLEINYPELYLLRFILYYNLFLLLPIGHSY